MARRSNYGYEKRMKEKAKAEKKAKKREKKLEKKDGEEGAEETVEDVVEDDPMIAPIDPSDLGLDSVERDDTGDDDDDR